MKKKPFILLMLSLATVACFTQNAGSVKGRVLDSESGFPLPGANVYVDYSGIKTGTITDKDGYYTVKPLMPGTYEVIFSFVGYTGRKILTTVYPGETTFIKDVKLAEGILLGGDEGFVVTADRYDTRLVDPGQIGKISINAEDIANIPFSDNIAMVLRATTSEIQISSDGKDIIFRGSRNGSSACYIDGVKQNNLTSSIPGCAVGSVSVYSGGIPARYGDVTGGIIVIESKGYFDVMAAKRIREAKRKEMKKTE